MDTNIQQFFEKQIKNILLKSQNFVTVWYMFTGTSQLFSTVKDQIDKSHQSNFL